MLALLPVLVALSMQGQQATLLGDAHVSSARPAVNSGSLSNLNVGGGFTALVQFDLGTLPAGITAAQITRATLRVYCNRADTPGTVSVQPVGAAWGESTVTYATLPSLGAVVQTAQAGLAGQFVTFDVTSTVQGWVSVPATNNGLALTAGSAVVQFDSKENDQTAHAPELEIALAAGGAASAGLTGATGATGPAGATGAVGPAGPMGAIGPAGANGLQGATGATGVAGATGAVGATGPAGSGGDSPGATGATGATGSPGLVYQGTYSSVTNYALGDVVVFAGSSYVSLSAFNDGNTPGLSPDSWGLLTAQGPIGLTGAAGPTGATGLQGLPGTVGPPGEQGAPGLQGIAGEAGAQGIPGTTGTQGLQGPAGPQGVAGMVGLSFQGNYASTTNYALADGVFWQGAGWVSLQANNHGNTPDLSPEYWAMFAASGVAGATGATGATGDAGAAGLPGTAGAAGTMGATGATGATGTPGLVYQGTYASTTNYALGDVVLYAGSSYASLIASNHGNTPDLSPSAWGMLTSIGPAGPIGLTGTTGPAGVQGSIGLQGPQGGAGPAGGQGIQGPAGAQGLTGANGVQGPVGPTGSQGLAGQAGAQGLSGATGPTGSQGPAGVQGLVGPIGLSFIGAYDSGVNYALGNGVLWQGAGWVSLIDGNHGNTPDQSPAAWAMFSAQGNAGAAGATGVQGVAGPQGPAGATGSIGPAGTAGSTGVAGATGATGPAGGAGPTGAIGINFRGPWTQLTYYNTNDAVTFNGSTYLAQAAGANLEPDINSQTWEVIAQAGGAGPTGAAGTAATLSIGTVTTLGAGVAATVNITGTAQAAVLNFGIPQGATGAAGSSGSGTVNTNAYAAMYHPVSYGTLYYAVNSPNASEPENATVLAWVPLGCTASELNVYSQQSGNITVTLRTGTPTSMANTALSCTPSTSGSCPVTGSVAIPAGNFIDFSITNASGTTAGVWTSLQCN